MSVWLELFYDLVFVAAILVLSVAASHLEDGVRVARIVAVFVGLWSVWLATTFFANRYRVQDMTHRLLVLAQMFIVVLVAMEAHAGVRHDAVYLSFTYAGLAATVAVMYTRVARTNPTGPETRDGGRWRRGSRWASFSSPRWCRGRSAPASGSPASWLCSCRRSPVPGRPAAVPASTSDHLVERMGAFTIIVCGEAFVKVAIAVSGSTVNEVDVVALFFQFVLTFAIWTSYFEDVPNAGIRPAGSGLARTAPRVAARDRRHRDRRREAGEGRSARPRSVRGHPRDHRDARRRLPRARADRRLHAAQTRPATCSCSGWRHGGRRGRRRCRVADRLRRPRRGRRRARAWSRCSTRSCRTG